MKILLAPDKFKDGLTAINVCKAMALGISGRHETVICPLADGGEGTSEILTFHSKGQAVDLLVKDPLFREINSGYGISGDGKTAYIEMAKASGLELLKREERNCMKTTTFGTGEMILDAIHRGIKNIILGIGGSATNDAGIGMASSLGYRFLDETGNEIVPVGGNLINVKKIDNSSLKVDLKSIKIQVACDVKNPLYGPNGAAYTYSSQKGATSDETEVLDRGLQNIAYRMKIDLGKDMAEIPGAGAAGGMGAGALAFLDATLVPGIDLVIKHTGFENLLEGTDLILTGEGSIDEQSLTGKVLQGITSRAKKHNIPVIAFCGRLALDEKKLKETGLTAAFSIINGPLTLDQALKNTAPLLTLATSQVVRIFENHV